MGAKSFYMFFFFFFFVEDVNSQKAGGLYFMPLRYKLCIGKLTSDYISPYLNAFLFTIRSLVAAF